MGEQKDKSISQGWIYTALTSVFVLLVMAMALFAHKEINLSLDKHLMQYSMNAKQGLERLVEVSKSKPNILASYQARDGVIRMIFTDNSEPQRNGNRFSYYQHQQFDKEDKLLLQAIKHMRMSGQPREQPSVIYYPLIDAGQIRFFMRSGEKVYEAALVGSATIIPTLIIAKQVAMMLMVIATSGMLMLYLLVYMQIEKRKAQQKRINEMRDYTDLLSEQSSRRLHALNKLHNNHKHLHQMVNQVDSLMVQVDVNGRVKDCNNAYATLLGKDIKALRGTDVTQYLSKEDAKTLLKVVAEKRYHKTELKVHLSDKVKQYYDVTVQPLTGSDEHTSMCSMNNIHQLKQQIEKGKLERRLITRQSINKSVSINYLSHQIRTQSGNLDESIKQLMQRTPEEKGGKQSWQDALNVVRKSAEELVMSSGDLLDYSSIDTGKLLLENKPFDIRQAMDACIDEVSAQMTHCRVHYAIDADVSSMMVGDEYRYRQVIKHALSKMTYSGRGTCRNAIHVSVKNAHTMHIKVEQINWREDVDTQKKPSMQQVALNEVRDNIVTALIKTMGGAVCSSGNTSFEFELPMNEELGEPFMDMNKRVLVLSEGTRLCENYDEQFKIWGMRNRYVESINDYLKLSSFDEFAFHIIDVERMYKFSSHAELEDDILALVNQVDNKTPLVLLANPVQISMLSKLNQKAHFSLVETPIRHLAFRHTLYEFGMIDLSAEQRKLTHNSAVDFDKGYKVLLAEDNAVSAELAKHMLANLGLQVKHASNGEKAYHMIASEEFDLILMDCEMPVLDGYEAAMMIREDKQHDNQGIPILALTANTLNGDDERCYNAGMDSYIRKPLNLDVLVKQLESFEAAIDTMQTERSKGKTLEA